MFRPTVSPPNFIPTKTDAKLAILRAFNTFCKTHATIGVVQNRYSFVKKYNAGAVGCGAEQLIKKISAPSLSRWQKSFANGGMSALIPQYGKNKGQGIIDRTPELRGCILALMA